MSINEPLIKYIMSIPNMLDLTILSPLAATNSGHQGLPRGTSRRLPNLRSLRNMKIAEEHGDAQWPEIFLLEVGISTLSCLELVGCTAYTLGMVYITPGVAIR